MFDWSVLLKSLEVTIILGMIDFLHGLGQFIAARFHGIGPVTFGFGLGPRLLGTTRNGIRYELRMIPLGGYLRLGEQSAHGRTDAPDEFLSRSRWVRLQVHVAGPAMNFLVAFL